MKLTKNIFKLAVIGIILSLSGCLNSDSSSSTPKDLRVVELPNPGEEDNDNQVEPETILNENGVIVASLRHDASGSQTINGAEGSNVATAKVVFDRYGLQRNIDVKLEEGESLSSLLELRDLNDSAQSSAAVLVTSSDPFALNKKFTVEIPLPETMSLTSESNSYIVAYKTIVPGVGVRTGLFGPESFEIKDNKARLFTQFFGSFQVFSVTDDQAAKVDENYTESRDEVIEASSGLNYSSADSYSSSSSVTSLIDKSNCTDPDLTKISEDVQVITCDGSYKKGTLKTCSGSGDSSCLVATNTVAVPESTLKASMLSARLTVGSVSGKIKTNCRNYGNDGVYDANLPPGNSLSTVTGTTMDWWDTVDDLAYFNNSFSANRTAINNAPGFDSFTECLGGNFVDATSEVGPTSSVNKSTFSGGPNAVDWSATFKNEVLGLYITNVIDNNATDWSEAVVACDSLNDGGEGGNTIGSDWRLPTQKEMMSLYIEGILALEGAPMGTLSSEFFMSATSNTLGASQAYMMELDRGQVRAFEKANTNFSYLCIHDIQ